MTARLLLVEDDESIGTQVVKALSGQGYDVGWARTAAEATAAAATPPAPDLVLLDLGLPDLDGVVLCRQLRERLPQTVIVILTARDTEIDVVVGLEAGADDYLVKPFRFAELLARLRAHLRRGSGAAPAAESAAGAESLQVGRVVVDLMSRRCLIGGEEVELRPKEFDLLTVLLRHAGRAVSREQLMSDVWDEHWFGSTKTLDMHISALRRKLSGHGEDPERIATLRGFGYRYEDSSAAS